MCGFGGEAAMLHTCVAACRSSSIINCGSIINELRRAVRRVPIAQQLWGGRSGLF
jgi:hypothetical protein